MPTRHLLPFALPTGRTGRVGRLTVYFSPRLKDRGQLRDYPEWLDWPETLPTHLALDVFVDGSKVGHRVLSPSPSSAVWTAVFGPGTPVAAHRVVDFRDTPLQPMASGDFSEAVLDLYLRTAREHPDGPPSGPQLRALAAAAGFGSGSAADEPGSLAEANAYRAPMADPNGNDPAAPRFDFHASLSLLGHHPELLRHLGLAVDLEVDLPVAPGRVHVTTGYGVPGGPRFEADLVTRTTADFRALPNPEPTRTEQSDGFLRLAVERAFLSVVDPQLAASRLTQAAGQADRHGEGTLPALATRALTLVRPDLTNTFDNRTKRQAELEDALEVNLTGGASVKLFAEDVTVGHRIDVLDLADAPTWLSLFERQSDAGYTFPRDCGLTVVPKPDEGWNTTILVTEQEDVRPEPDPDKDESTRPTALFRLDDAMFRWNGWSGAAPPPGSVLDSSTGRPVAAEPNQPTDHQAAQVAVDYRVVPGSLPRLRFGRTYRMRARCVDLAGNSRELSTATDPAAAVAPETFGRLEPIAAPIVVRRSARPVPGVGDTTDVVVLRSDIGVDDATVEPVDRLIFPGRVGQDLCELHGLPAGGTDPASYGDLTRRDARDLTDQTVTDPVSGEVVAGVTNGQGGPVEAGPTRQNVEYLCDPAAVSVRFAFSGSSVGVPLPGVWPKRQAARLLVAAGDAPFAVRPDAETELGVFVPKAGIVALDVSFGIDGAVLDHFALWQRFTATEQADLADHVGGGAHWLFTPARSLTLVHAVRRPLLAPAVAGLTADRRLGSATVVLDGSLVASDASTARIAVTGDWTDTVDDPGSPGPPEARSTRLPLGSITVPRGETNEVAVASLRAQLPDTKRHLVRISLEAFSRFAEYFTEERRVVLADGPVVLDGGGVVAGMVEVRLPDGARARAGADFVVDGPRGTIWRVDGGALSDGVRVLVRYVALPISRTSEGEPFEIVFPNTAVPPLPVVDEVVPSFAHGADGRHSGQTLRIYLARPWLVTGDGEQLAVVLDSGGTTATAVARDPIVAGSTPLGPVPAVDFPRAVSVVPGVGAEPDLVGHAVSFDADSGRWYADIELADRFGYRPFLRLAVARHQPGSIPGATTSPTLVLDPVRLGVVRRITAVRDGGSVEVTVAGAGRPGNIVLVSVQRADPTIGDDDLRWRPAGGPVALVATVEGTTTTWSGRVDLPETPDPVRVVIEELEPGRQDEAGAVVEVRVAVYVATVELPSS